MKSHRLHKRDGKKEREREKCWNQKRISNILCAHNNGNRHWILFSSIICVCVCERELSFYIINCWNIQWSSKHTHIYYRFVWPRHRKTTILILKNRQWLQNVKPILAFGDLIQDKKSAKTEESPTIGNWLRAPYKTCIHKLKHKHSEINNENTENFNRAEIKLASSPWNYEGKIKFKFQTLTMRSIRINAWGIENRWKFIMKRHEQ